MERRRLMRIFRKRQQSRVVTIREAMAVLRATSRSDLTDALGDDHHQRADTALAAAIGVLERWFQQLPPDRAEPEMTFHEFIRLLHQALQAG